MQIYVQITIFKAYILKYINLKNVFLYFDNAPLCKVPSLGKI